MIIVLFDLDETLINGRVIDALALEYNFNSNLKRLRTNLRKGLISHEVVTRSIIKLLEGKRVVEIINVAKSIPLMLNAENVLGALKSRGFKIGIISDGLTVITNSFANRLGLDYSIGHEAEITDGKLTGNVRLAMSNGEYITWKKEKIKEIRKGTNSEVIAVGNGDLDAPMLKEADIGIAFNATPKAQRAADMIVNNKDLNEVLKVIELLGP